MKNPEKGMNCIKIELTIVEKGENKIEKERKRGKKREKEGKREKKRKKEKEIVKESEYKGRSRTIYASTPQIVFSHTVIPLHKDIHSHISLIIHTKTDSVING